MQPSKWRSLQRISQGYTGQRCPFGTCGAAPLSPVGSKGSLFLARPGYPWGRWLKLLPEMIQLKWLQRGGVQIVWTDASGRHSSNPHFRLCGVGYALRRQVCKFRISFNFPYYGSRSAAHDRPLKAQVQRVDRAAPKLRL
eukprot:5072951-Amphidinium_carterae.1